MTACGWRFLLLEDLPAALLILQDERLTYANTMARALFGLTDAQLKGTGLSERVAEDRRTKLREILQSRQQSMPVEPRMTVSMFDAHEAVIAVELLSRVARIAVQPALETICIPMLESRERRQPDGGKGRQCGRGGAPREPELLPERDSGSAGRRRPEHGDRAPSRLIRGDRQSPFPSHPPCAVRQEPHRGRPSGARDGAAGPFVPCL
jgi:PAS domain S-box-containing protein